MRIPFKYNPMGSDPNQDVSGGALVGVRGCFTYLPNGRCNQSAMSMTTKTLRASNLPRIVASASGTVSRMRMYASTYATANAGTLTGVEMMSSARLNIQNGGTVSGLDMGEYCTCQIESGGGVATDITMGGSAYMAIQSGGTASGVSAMGYRANITVSSGGRLLDATIDGGDSAYVYVSSGAYASGICLSSGYSRFFDVASGGTAHDIAIGVNMSMRVPDGAEVSKISMASAATLIVSRNAVANDITIADGGRIALYTDGETDDRFSVNGTCARGSFSADSMTVSNVPIAYGSAANYASVVDCQVFSNFSLSAGAKASRTTWGPYHTSAYGYINTKCSALENTVRSNMRLYVQNRGYASGNVISQYGTMFVDNASAAQTTVSSGGMLLAYNNATADGNTISGGGMTIYSNAKADSIDLQSGIASVFNYGTAGQMAVSSGGRCYIHGAGRVDSLTVNGGSLYMDSTADIGEMTIGENGAYISCNSRYAISGQTLPNSVNLQMAASGTASGVAFGNGCSLYMAAYGTARDIAMGANASCRIEGNCNAQNISLGSGGSLYMSNVSGTGTLAVGESGLLSIGQYTGQAGITAGAYASTEIGNVPNAEVTIGDGAVFRLNSAGSAVWLGASASGSVYGGTYAAMNIGGNANVYLYNASLTHPVIGNGASIRIGYRGRVEYAEIRNGAKIVGSGEGSGFATDITVGSGAEMSICYSCSANVVTVESGGSLYCDGYRAYVSSVTSQEGAIITGNSIYIIN